MLAYICSALIIVASAFHFYWGFGGRYGRNVAIPQYPNGERVFNPNPGATHIIGGVLLGIVLCLLNTANIIELPIPRSVPRIATAFLSVVFVIRAIGWFHYVGFFKRIRNTPFARYDTWFYCPLCLFLGISFGFILLND